MDILNAADLLLLQVINAPAGQHAAFDLALALLRDVSLLKAGPFMLLWWWLWLVRRDRPQDRHALLAILVVAVPALALGRALALALPYRPRPVHADWVTVNIPLGMPEQILSGWSAMPSDHAVLFVALAVAFLFVSRAAGGLALVYALVFICLPRVYSGLHFPSDILVGALAGAVTALALMPWLTRQIARLVPVGLSRARQVKVQVTVTLAAVLMSSQIATMFEIPRQIVRPFGLE